MPGTQAWIAVTIAGVLCTGLAYILYFRLIENTGPARALTVTFAIPVFAVIYGGLFLGEQVTPWMVACGAIIIVGTALVQRAAQAAGAAAASALEARQVRQAFAWLLARRHERLRAFGQHVHHHFRAHAQRAALGREQRDDRVALDQAVHHFDQPRGRRAQVPVFEAGIDHPHHHFGKAAAFHAHGRDAVDHGRFGTACHRGQGRGRARRDSRDFSTMPHIVVSGLPIVISRVRVDAWEEPTARRTLSRSPMQSETAASATSPLLGRAHARRLRDLYRSAGWPCHDALEIDLLAAGLLERLRSPLGHETLRVTDPGVQWLAAVLARNRAALSAHEVLVERVAQEMARAGRLAWTGLSLRAQVPTGDVARPLRWCVARPDVFSIRQTSVESYVEPIVHEIKVRRADLLADLRQEAKRGAYRDLGACWYVLGNDAKGRAVGEPDEVPAECGVLLLQGDRLVAARPAAQPARAALPFGVWMALAKATPLPPAEEDAQGLLDAAN